MLYMFSPYVHTSVFIQRGEYETLKRKTPADLWISDLDRFIEELDVSRAIYQGVSDKQAFC